MSSPRVTHPGSWRVGRLAGVDVLIKPSLLAMGAVLVLVFAPRFDDRSDTNPYILAAAFVIALYVSIFVHELAHVALARYFRMQVHSVTLHLLGGETVIEGESRSPWQELTTSIAGPVASLGIGLVAKSVSGSMGYSTAADVLWSIGAVNIIIAIFNMLPGLPLDGGRVFRAIIWQVTGNEETGIRIAAWIGRVTAVGIVVFAVLRGRDDQTFAVDLLISAFIAWFLWQGAGEALRHAHRAARLNLLVARTLADTTSAPPPDAVRISADLHGGSLLRAMAASPSENYVLTEPDGSIYGVLSARAVDDAYRSSQQ